MQKFIKSLVALVVLLGVGFVGGLSSAPTAKLPVQTVAYEATPGPYGSGVLGDWSNLSHGLYCFTAGTLTNSKTGYGVTKVTSYTKAAKATAPLSSSVFSCPGEDIRLYGDSITFGGKSAFAYEMGQRGLTTYVDAWSGRPTTPVADAILAETAFPPVVVVASGTNDMFNPTVMAAQINRIKNHIASVSPLTKLFWVDVQATRWGQTEYIERNDQRNSMAVNLAIYQNMPTNRVVQWTQRFMSNPNLMGTYLKDGVHPKDSASYAYWAAILRSWLDSLGGI
jgi:hypothetical protein